MTINGFSSFATAHLKSCSYTISAEDLRGKRIAIDLYLLLFQIRAVALKEVVTISTVQNEIANNPSDPYGWISARVNEVAKKRFFAKVISLLEHGWKCIFCLDDAESHPLREKVRNRRAIESEKRREKIRSLKEELKKCDPFLAGYQVGELVKVLTQDVSHTIFSLVSRISSILLSLGFPVLTPDDLYFGNYPTDGEAIAGTLSYLGLVDAIYTNDADAHTYGAEICITKMEGDFLTLRETSSILSVIGAKFHTENVSLLSFQTAAILAGVDYNENIKGIAFGKAIKLVLEVHSYFSEDEFLYLLLSIQLLQLLQKELPDNAYSSSLPFSWKWFQENAQICSEELEQFQQYLKNHSKDILFLSPYQLSLFLSSLLSNYSSINKSVEKFLSYLNEDCISYHEIFPLYRVTLRKDHQKLPFLKLSFDSERFHENARELLQIEDCMDYYSSFSQYLLSE